MWIKTGLTLIKNHLPALLLAGVAAAVAGVVFWNDGWRNGAADLAAVRRENSTLNQQVHGLEQEKREAAERQALALTLALIRQQEQQARAEIAVAALNKKQIELDTLRKQQKRRSRDAVKNDSVAYTGIGPDSLREYRTSLGYATGGTNVSKNPARAAGHTGNATGPGAGLQPIDLLSHAVDYGAWCLKLENQLRAIGNWSEGEH